MYTKVTPKAGQNGPMWLYAGFLPILWHVAVTTSYATFSMMVVGYITKYQHDLSFAGDHLRPSCWCP